jgi:hypothetical protein
MSEEVGLTLDRAGKRGAVDNMSVSCRICTATTPRAADTYLRPRTVKLPVYAQAI